MDPYKRDNIKGVETKTDLGVYYLAHSMFLTGVYWCCTFQDSVRKIEATACIPGGKDFNIGNMGLNNCWNSGEGKLPMVTSAWIVEENDSQYWMGRCNKPFVQLPLCLQLLVEIGDHSFSSTVQILWEDLLSNCTRALWRKVFGENHSHPRRRW